MAVSPHAFPPRKRRPSAGSFMSPNFSNHQLIQSLLLLSQEISSLQPIRCLLRRSSASIIRQANLLSVLFEELLREQLNGFSPSAVLCFEELYIVLQRIKTLIEDCSNGSKMWLLMQTESLANAFHELTVDLSTLLDIFPASDMNLNEDVAELVVLIRKQCSEKKAVLDPEDDNLRSDSTSCRDEIENLEDEVQNQTDEKSKSDVIALIGLVRYARCVLYEASTPRERRKRSVSDVNFPADFRCPISLDLMRDPVVVATGQTYDRASINLWIESGHNTCPKTGQTMAHTHLIPNRALKNLIGMWCREQRIPFEGTEPNEKVSVIHNKTALEATKMTVLFLVNKLTASQSAETSNCLVHELRVLAKADSDSRECIAEAGALPLLVKFLGPDHPNLQVNAVTTILNLSILESNKTRIMETDGVLNGVIEVLRSGATWEAKGNAAATIFSLTCVHANRKRLGRKTRVIKGLVELARVGPASSKRDALVAILSLAGERETVGKFVESGVVEVIRELMDGQPEEAVTILEVVVKRGGLVAVAAAYHLIRKLAAVLREGTDRARESAAATLVNICRKGGSETVAELATVTGIERVIWDMVGLGTGRGRRKAASLLRILRRWAEGLDGVVMGGHSSTTHVSSTSIVLPGSLNLS
ncbi:ARM repeat superfamily protein [Actinidia rufa]|uniref:RING-type E3 ubiquitin transferase n=1 Tax=Actinidia rufa TaxID=165716 RepID=A0A7J0EBI5_9ERIC|nr:ARM repeat superfamily protein [Actinidia rufa]